MILALVTLDPSRDGIGRGRHQYFDGDLEGPVEAQHLEEGAGLPDTVKSDRIEHWAVDALAPETTIDAGPTGTVATADADLAFSSPDADATFECRLDGGAWAACSAPVSLTGLADGPHTFEVRAVDAVGNADPTPAAQDWTVAVGP